MDEDVPIGNHHLASRSGFDDGTMPGPAGPGPLDLLVRGHRIGRALYERSGACLWSPGAFSVLTGLTAGVAVPPPPRPQRQQCPVISSYLLHRVLPAQALLWACLLQGPCPPLTLFVLLRCSVGSLYPPIGW